MRELLAFVVAWPNTATHAESLQIGRRTDFDDASPIPTSPSPLILHATIPAQLRAHGVAGAAMRGRSAHPGPSVVSDNHFDIGKLKPVFGRWTTDLGK